jgi:hypothetical protein
MRGSLWCHRHDFAGGELEPFTFGALHCPGEEFIGGHAMRRDFGHAYSLALMLGTLQRFPGIIASWMVRYERPRRKGQ